MAAFLHDTFTHTGNAQPLNAHAPEIGGAWVLNSGYWDATSNNVNIYNTGRARGTNSTGQSLAYNDTLPPGPDVFIQCTAGRESTLTTDIAYVYFRGDIAGDSAYRLDITYQNVLLRRINNGVMTAIAQSDLGVGFTEVDTPYLYEILCKGNQITVSHGGEIILTFTDDSPIETNGYVGIGNRRNGYIDELIVEDGAAGPSPAIGEIVSSSEVLGAGSSLSVVTAAAAG